MRWIAALAAVSLAGCVTTTSGAGSEPPRQVTFETTPCFGSCPVFSLTLDADGHGVYEGGRFVKTKGRHEFSASAKQVRAFFDRIRPFRPAGAVRYDMANCPGPAHTDAPSVNVRWISATRADSLDWNLGCRVDALQAIEPDLQNAWQELPLDDLVGRAENRFEYDQRGG
ncbi:MAG TPA: DUF6438 domain-containing protein [Croceibacterium sp.]|nr:DUF6438 domain-containing protein [Croceibacterium sp.]